MIQPIQPFVDRMEESKILEEHFNSGKPELVIMYGRRRVGKTELAAHFIRKKPGIYFLAEEKRYADNLNEMKQVMAGFLKDNEFGMIGFENWVQLFRGFSERVKERVVIVIDEFPYMVKENASVPSEFQNIWDTILSKSGKIMLMLIGSSVGMMERLLGAKSPLYGRRTAQLEIKPMSAFHIGGFLPGYGIEDCMRVYGCADGIPMYTSQFGSGSFSDDIKRAFLRRDSILYAEAELLLKQEFREPATYFAILKALSFGNTKQNEIVDYANVDKSIISKYMGNLEGVRIIRKEYPVTDRKEKRRNSRYAFSDNYFGFWFRFIYPNRALIESAPEKAFDIIKKSYETYMGAIFEKISCDFLMMRRPFPFTKIGRWWHHDSEIDIVALNEGAAEIFFIECKWSSLTMSEGIGLINKLKEKSRLVKWDNRDRKEHFGIMARALEGKEHLRKMGYFAFDIEDMAA